MIETADKQVKKSILCMHHTITPVAFIELLMSFTLYTWVYVCVCVFDINETDDDNVDSIAVFGKTQNEEEETGRKINCALSVLQQITVTQILCQ